MGRLRNRVLGPQPQFVYGGTGSLAGLLHLELTLPTIKVPLKGSSLLLLLLVLVCPQVFTLHPQAPSPV